MCLSTSACGSPFPALPCTVTWVAPVEVTIFSSTTYRQYRNGSAILFFCLHKLLGNAVRRVEHKCIPNVSVTEITALSGRILGQLVSACFSLVSIGFVGISRVGNGRGAVLLGSGAMRRVDIELLVL